MGKILANILILSVLGGLAYHYRDYTEPYVTSVKNIFTPLTPCKDIVTYSIGDFDGRFGLTEEEFLAILEEAEKPWEEAMGSELFQYSATGTLKVNLIYDYRQEATEMMQSIGIAINDDQNTYDQLKSRYDTLTADFNSQKAALQEKIEAYNTRKEAYEEQVRYYNNQGGAPTVKYAELQREQKSLSAEADSIRREQADLNTKGEDINSTVTILNNVARKLNMKVETYNEIGSSTGEEFSEGEYVRDNSGTRINIYQFENEAKLRRVLIHELGHALNLGHVDDKDAIMYRLNTSRNERLTQADLLELKTACKKN